LIKDSDSDGKQRFQYPPTAFIIGDADGYSLIGEDRSFKWVSARKPSPNPPSKGEGLNLKKKMPRHHVAAVLLDLKCFS
jgi:hypothetical protein